MLDAADWYKFTAPLGTTGTISAQIDFAHAQGDLNLYLWDASFNLLSKSLGTTDGERVIRADLAPGTYYVLVNGKADSNGIGAQNPGYTLTINPSLTPADDAFEQNDSLGQAKDLGLLNAPVTVSNLSLIDNADWFKFSVIGPRTSDAVAEISFQNVNGDFVALDLYDSAGRRINYRGSTSESVALPLNVPTTGTYYLKIYGIGQAVTIPSYTLTVNPGSFRDDSYEENDSFAQAFDLGLLTAPINNLPLELNDGADWFRFTMNGAATKGYVELQLVGDAGLRFYDSTGKLLASSMNPNLSTERIDFNTLSPTPLAGTYYIEVYSAAPATLYYFLTISPAVLSDNLPGDDQYEENDSSQFGTSYFNLGTLSTPLTISNLALLDANDYYTFKMTATGTSADYVQIDFAHAQGNLELQISDAFGAHYGYSSTGTDTERVSLAGFAAGTIYVHVYGWGGATNPSYTMTIDPAGSVLGAPTEAVTVAPLAEEPVLAESTLSANNFSFARKANGRTLYLNFDGARMTRADLERWGSDWFYTRPAGIDPEGDGVTVTSYQPTRRHREQLINRIIERVQNDLSPFGVKVVRHRGLAVEGVGATTIFVGEHNIRNAGSFASDVDVGNNNRTDIAFVDPPYFGSYGDLENEALYQSNVILHEAGHTYGLFHVNAGTQLEAMDEYFAFHLDNRRFVDRSFQRADGGGLQNSYRYMMQIFASPSPRTASSTAAFDSSLPVEASQAGGSRSGWNLGGRSLAAQELATPRPDYMLADVLSDMDMAATTRNLSAAGRQALADATLAFVNETSASNPQGNTLGLDIPASNAYEGGPLGSGSLSAGQVVKPAASAAGTSLSGDFDGNGGSNDFSIAPTDAPFTFANTMSKRRR